MFNAGTGHRGLPPRLTLSSSVLLEQEIGWSRYETRQEKVNPKSVSSQLQSKHPNSHRVANVTKYKALPSDWKTKAHYYFYGWAVTKEIIQRYLSSISRAHVSYEDEIGVASSGIFYMQRDVGLDHINYVGGKVDKEAAANYRVEQTEGPMLNLMSIGCTWSKRLFWRRPTPKQLERLIEIFWGESNSRHFSSKNWVKPLKRPDICSWS
ncbi:hypothetical protein BYT27DRAFT_7218477 [Phlegmacium glaucopus]|nr:hypothetical protein BYT27DRAFT_7218477 [Phlegmacium glaucopus]